MGGNRILLNYSTTPFGKELAEAVADALSQVELCYGHRDYCGTGLKKNDDGSFIYAEFEDGRPSSVLETFSDKASFAEWLSQQSEKTLSREDQSDSFKWGNQTITRGRLDELIERATAART